MVCGPLKELGHSSLAQAETDKMEVGKLCRVSLAHARK